MRKVSFEFEEEEESDAEKERRRLEHKRVRTLRRRSKRLKGQLWRRSWRIYNIFLISRWARIVKAYCAYKHK